MSCLPHFVFPFLLLRVISSAVTIDLWYRLHSTRSMTSPCYAVSGFLKDNLSTSAQRFDSFEICTWLALCRHPTTVRRCRVPIQLEYDPSLLTRFIPLDQTKMKQKLQAIVSSTLDFLPNSSKYIQNIEN